MATEPDTARLQTLLEQEGLRWVLDRLAERMQQGKPLQGTIVNTRATPEERRAIDDLLGRRSTGGARLSLDLALLEQTLRKAGLSFSLEDAVLACRGPIRNMRAESERERAEWAALFESVRERIAGNPALERWTEALRSDGSLKRMTAGDVAAASQMMETALQVIERFPCRDILLANLAAECTGDSHALDRGQPVATICLRAIAALYGVEGQSSATARREAWATAGVLIDDLSAPALVFNFRATPNSPLEQILSLHRAQRQPAFISYRQLQAHGAFTPLDEAMRTVFVCENPSVISAAARELGERCRPIVCTNGQPASAVRLLLAQLAHAGAELRCHADFDWAGMQIIDQCIRTYGAVPWRMSAADYEVIEGTAPLQGSGSSHAWAGDLPEALRVRGKAVFEEQMIGTLLLDLAEPV